MATIFHYDVVDDRSLHVVQVYGELDLLHADEFRRELVAIAGSTVRVDLSGLRFIDSTGLTVLLAARDEIISLGHGFELRGASGVVRRVFEITGLAHLLTD